MIGKYVIVRSERAGVFAGTLTAQDGQQVDMANVRRLWYWDGAASLSQIAVSGVSKAKSCKFSVVTSAHRIMGVIEIIPCTAAARKIIEAVPEWTA